MRILRICLFVGPFITISNINMFLLERTSMKPLALYFLVGPMNGNREQLLDLRMVQDRFWEFGMNQPSKSR